MTTTTISPESINWHSLIQGLPRWADDSPEMLALVEDIRERGIDQPLIVCRTDGGGTTLGTLFLLDGRHRHRASVLAGLTEVPVVERVEADAMGIVLNSLVQRRHYTKSALAFVTWPMFSNRVKGSGGDRKSARKNQKPNHSGFDQKQIAAQVGVSEDLIGFAKAAHELFAERPDLRDKFEPAILAGELSLNRLPGAVAGRESTIGKNRANPEPDQLLFQGFDMLKTRFSRWEKIAEAERSTIAAEWVRTVYDLPDDVQRRTYESLHAKFK